MNKRTFFYTFLFKHRLHSGIASDHRHQLTVQWVKRAPAAPGPGPAGSWTDPWSRGMGSGALLSGSCVDSAPQTKKPCLSSHQRPSRPISFPLRFLLSTGRLLKIELSISQWVRHRWDSNRRSGGLIIVIYQNQHFEASAECLSDGETLNHLKQTEIF